jgi:hypothetical protein
VHQFHSASAAALDSMRRGSNLVNLQLSISLARVVGLRSVHRADDFARYVGHANATNTRQRHANKKCNMTTPKHCTLEGSDPAREE